MSIFFMSIIASNARAAVAPPCVMSWVKRFGVICQDSPKRSLHQPHALSAPPPSVIAFH